MTKKVYQLILMFLIVFVFDLNPRHLNTSSLSAQIKLTKSVSSAKINLDIKEYTLKNGMKVLILERHASPTIAVNMVFKVGSVNEYPGITGISHMLEHMMFKGSRVIGTKDYDREKPILEKIDRTINRLNELKQIKKQHSQNRPGMENQEIKVLESELQSLFKTHQTYVIPNGFNQIYQRQGARGLNAGTSKGNTLYYCQLPANKLELWAWLESDRFSNPVWRSFYQEQMVVAEERRLRCETNPQGLLYEEFKALAYKAHPLRWPVIGWMSDIKSYSKKKLIEYFKKYYVPNNTIIVIVGDVRAEKALNLIKKYFEPIQAQSPPPLITTIEPPQQGERRITIELDTEPALIIGYHTVKLGDQDDYVLDIISSILTRGRTSRLYQNLILKKKLCLNINTANESGKYPGLFTISAKPKNSHTTSEVESAIYEELERLKQEPVSEEELQKTKKQIAVAFLKSLKSNEGMASTIAYHEANYSWKHLQNAVENYNAVTTMDIITASKKYFVPHNRSVATLVKNKEKQ